MRVKICGVRIPEDIDIVVQADADAVGFLVGQIHPSRDFILPSTAARLVAKLPPYISPVLVTHFTESEKIKELVDKTGIFTVQLHGGCPLIELKKIRDWLPLNSKIILVAHVIDKQLKPELDDFLPFIDAIVLDKFNEQNGAVGGTGMIQDWKICAELVKNLSVPVILAGGLNPDNVGEAINTVQPYGVDANSCLKTADGNCDLDLCRNFVKIAKSLNTGH